MFVEAETVGRSRREIRGNILKTPHVTGHGNGSLRSVKVEQVIGFIRNDQRVSKDARNIEVE